MLVAERTIGLMRSRLSAPEFDSETDEETCISLN
jgi:hypothetical protein